jgi:hypothetical protein
VQKRTTAQKTIIVFFLRGGRSIKGRRKKERKEGKQQVWRTTSSFLTTHSVCPRKSYQSSCFVWIRLEFWRFGNRVVVDLGFQRHSLFLFYFWGESLSLSVPMERCCQLLLSSLVSFSLSVFHVLGFLFQFFFFCISVSFMWTACFCWILRC